ncbi:MAG: PAS domain S-box protein [Leptolyngbyaceae cyanobacterium bins.302]|nr:PAS domain S-box protein [Leptolyngbyaceae cyanobacterium bins.302]
MVIPCQIWKRSIVWGRELVQSKPYAIAILSVCVATAMTLTLDPWLKLSYSPFLLFFGALTVSAFYGGSKAGLLATVLSAIVTNYYFLENRALITLDLAANLRALLFFMQGSVISLICGSLQQAQRRNRISLKQLQSTQNRFRHLVSSNIIGVMICDVQGAITEANDEFLRMTGFTQEDVLTGRARWDDMTPEDLRSLDDRALEELIHTGKHTPFEKVYVGKSGQRIPVIVGSAMLDDSDHVVSFVLDLTPLKQTKQQLMVQYAVTRGLAEATTLAEAISAVLQALCESLDWQVGIAWRIDEESNVMRFVECWQETAIRQAQFETATRSLTFTPGVGLPGRIWTEGHPIWIKSLVEETNFPYLSIVQRVGLQSALGFPILLGNEVLGVIECFSTQQREPDQDLLQLMGAIGNQIGQFMERKQSEEDLRKSEQLYRAIGESIDYGIWVCAPDGRNIYASESFLRLVGLTQEQCSEFGWGDVLHPNDAEQTIADWKAYAHSGGLWDREHRFRGVDGKWHPILGRGVPVRDAQGEILCWAGINLDISRLKQVEADLRESEERFRLAARAVAGVVYDWNLQTGSVYRSEGLIELLGFHPNEVAALTNWWEQRIHPEDLPNTQASWEHCTTQGQDRFSIEYRVQHRDGHWITVWDRGYLMRDEHHNIVRVVGSSTDISDRKQAEAEREKLLERERIAREQAEAANRIKDEFLAVLSHELRSPLNPILGWTKLLRTRKFDPATTDRALEIIERNAKLQTQLIEDLLDVSRILRGKLVLNAAPVNLATTIESAIETVRLAAEAKAIDLQFDLSASPTASIVSGDEGRLQQIIWNLLSNAVKFTPEGGRVEVRLEQVSGRGVGEWESGRVGEWESGSVDERPSTHLPTHPPTPTYAQITVKDTGKGISTDFLPYVFEYFRQADSTITRKFGGLGLGLAIVRHLTELHGGTVGVESIGEDQGATFWVRLPLLREAQLRQRNFERPAPRTDLLQGLKVFVVDDDEDMRHLVTVILQEYGATVKSTLSPKAALQQLAEFAPDVLVSDVGMPEMDGYTFLQAARSMQAGKDLPAIALTAYAGEHNQQQALAAGFQVHIAKPVEPEALVTAIAFLAREKA